MEIREEDSRTARVLGKSGVERLKNASVAVFGVGGVGGYLCEALARAGVGRIDLFDNDDVSLSNINRQIIALHSTVGKAKVEVMRERILDINPECDVRIHKVFYLPENADTIPLAEYSYVADAVDTVAAKLELAVRCQRENVKIISAMGAGNKLDPTRFEVADVFATSGCPLARVMRTELKKRGVTKLKVVFSKEPAAKCPEDMPEDEGEEMRKRTPGSLSFVPSVVGLIMAGEIIREIAEGR